LPPEGRVLTFPTPVRIKNPLAVALGLLGGSKGGRKRAENLSAERRKAIAQQAARARWTKVRNNRTANH
jgi:hypothetical protein